MLSMPDNWFYIKTKFWRETNLGRNAFNNAWKELETYGYIQSERIKDGNLVRGYNYIISDLPIFGNSEHRTSQNLDNQRLVDNKSNIDKDVETKKDLNKSCSNDNLDTRGVGPAKSFSEIFYNNPEQANVQQYLES